jgi:hypothetical protein
MGKYIVAWSCNNNNTWGSFRCNSLKETKKDGREVARGNTFEGNSYSFLVKRKVDSHDSYETVYSSKGKV